MTAAVRQRGPGRAGSTREGLPPRDSTELVEVRARPGWPALAAIAAMPILLGLCEAHAPVLELNRPAIAGGQWWRLITGNFVHYGAVHAVCDWGAFVVLGWLALRRKAPLPGLVMLSALAVGAAAYAFAGSITTYRGISGINYAVLAWLAVTIVLRDGGGRAILAAGLLLGLVAKTVLLAADSQTLLPGLLPTGVAVVPAAHAAGMAAGALLAGVAGVRGVLAARGGGGPRAGNALRALRLARKS